MGVIKTNKNRPFFGIRYCKCWTGGGGGGTSVSGVSGIPMGMYFELLF